MNSDKLLDAKGLACPMPVVKTKKEVDQLESGQVLEIHATDKGSESDMVAWAKTSGHELLAQEQDGETFKFWIRKA
ncbi:sulfurtransferase TusA family protein [Texcoconibacillus texcoconensis]|uniref:TusA-related sulfurtransferase n=1 Tax=Texcoconibacillus texcoconensis TaxID=1095777 RepID=A0A840QQS4_9BACI|nr:sulfurtransferase TusA family protein [Texcoconibacillus texcoconensis]MBB5173796.1 TusA-related sulfurtransferase [Texcoconibacillus texcoconensis]